MIVILEGCDGSGKSTLASRLVSTFGLHYHHEGPPPADITPLEHYGGLIESHRWAIHRGEMRGVVFDRLALGERVYGNVYRDNDRLGADGWNLVKRVMRAAGAVHIICMPTFDTCLTNWRANKHNELIAYPGQLARVYDRYTELMKRDQIDTSWVYNYTAPDALRDLEMLLEVPRVNFPPGIIGHPRAKFLFVGEIGSKSEGPTADMAFFGMEDSSGYLNRALVEAGYPEDDLAFTNAERHDGQKITWPLRCDTIVALGKKAVAECRARSLRFVEMPHPQYWRRFHSVEHDVYVDKLRDIRMGRAI